MKNKDDELERYLAIQRLKETLKDRLMSLVLHFVPNISDDDLDKYISENMDMIEQKMRSLKNAAT